MAIKRYSIADICYTIGIVDGNEIGFIGWCNETDYYELYYSDCLQDKGDFLAGYVDLEDYDAEPDKNGDYPLKDCEIYIYKGNTINEIKSYQKDVQREYSDKVDIIKLESDGDGWWYPIKDFIIKD